MGKPYEHQEYPKRVYRKDYHVSGESKLVQDGGDERAALDSGDFFGSPAECPAPPPKRVPSGRRAVGGATVNIDAADEGDEPAADLEIDGHESAELRATATAAQRKAKK